MLSRLKGASPSPALVISLIALFVSLGGAGYAAVTVTGKNVKDSSLTGKDIKNSSVTGKDVKNSSLTGSDVKNDKLTGSDILESSLGKVPSADAAGNADKLDGADSSDFARAGNKGIALAGVNVTDSGTVLSYFNNFGGAPTVSHTATSGIYVVTFPGLAGKLLYTNVVQQATLNDSGPGNVSTNSSSSNPYVTTFTSGGTAQDHAFTYVVFGTDLAP
jgi:hypothetical protein